MIRNLRMRVQQRGVWRTVSKAIRTLVPTRFDIWERDLSTEPAPVKKPQVQVSVGAEAVEQLARLRQANPGLPADFYRDRVLAVQSCVIGVVDGCLAGIGWAYDHTHTGRFLRMRPGDVELRSVYSLPEYRGRGVAKAVIRGACWWLRNQGFKRIYAVIHPNNFASSRAFAAVGFRKTGQLHRPALFGPHYLAEEGRPESWSGVLRNAISVPSSLNAK
jgi:GNAT superfamily N-acetyltransferase